MSTLERKRELAMKWAARKEFRSALQAKIEALRTELAEVEARVEALTLDGAAAERLLARELENDSQSEPEPE